MSRDLVGLQRLDPLAKTSAHQRRPRSSGLGAEERRRKVREVNRALESDPVDLATLRLHALSPDGLVNDELRLRVWPKLVAVDVYAPVAWSKHPEKHKDYNQVLLDVGRSDRRFPPGIRARYRRFKQQELTDIIMRVLQACTCPELHYYQGFHELAVPFLLVCGLDIACRILVQLCQSHLREYMGESMSDANVLLSFLYPLIAEHDSDLEEFLVKSEVGTVFSLSWLITWYSHVVPDLEMVSRLFDVFLASHPLFPLYFAAMIVLDRRKEVMAVECELSAVHSVLSHLIDEHLPVEILIAKAVHSFKCCPPVTLATRHKLDIDKSLVMAAYRRLLRDLSRQKPDRILHSRKRTKDGTESGRTSLAAQVAVWALSAAFGVAAYFLYESS